MTAGERLKIARKNAGMTQLELGKKLGVTPNLINQYENGVRNITYKNAERLAKTCGVSECWLVRGCELNETITDRLYATTEMEICLLNTFRLMDRKKQEALLELIRVKE